MDGSGRGGAKGRRVGPAVESAAEGGEAAATSACADAREGTSGRVSFPFPSAVRTRDGRRGAGPTE